MTSRIAGRMLIKVSYNVGGCNAEMYALNECGGGVSEVKSALACQGTFWPWTDTPTAQFKNFARLSAYWGIHWDSRTAAFVKQHSFAVHMLRPK